MINIIRRVMSMGGMGRYARYISLIALIAVPLLAAFSLGGSGKSKWVILLVTFVTLLVLLGIFFLFMMIWKKKKGNQLTKALRRDADSVEISGIESMRSNFEEGVDKLRKAGKNVYDLPWFLLAGQAGSGKTEAVRRSHRKEDFPPGLNDLMQGVGGTLNMNWWFTNQSIILDTAGRVFEAKVEAGKSNEWQEFMKMLKRVRKNTPINGFILVIPADSLIRDDFSEIEGKASHIAEQITLVQNVLGVRFPVFILITKTDFIPGFREFVAKITEPDLQQQMLGWSNPSGLDEAFEPEHVDQYLDDIITKLKKRRLAYMLDPRAEDGEKRLDDIDALFAFPEELRSAIPNLRRYIEIVFSLNPWTKKPLFIRGIYFTSSLQQGDALDKAIAEIMGKKLDDFALSSFKKETPLFLRDSFFNKIYKETGLVTSSGEVKSAMRRRTLTFAATCLVGLAVILTVSISSSRAFRKSIGNEYEHWRFAEQQYQESIELDRKYDWGRPIVYDTGMEGAYETEKDVTFEVSGQQYTLPTYLERMGIFAESKLKVPGIFRPFKFFNDLFTGNKVDRKSAYRHLYEDAVIYPIIKNSRAKMESVDEDTWDSSYADGLSALIQVQLLLNQTERDEEYPGIFFEKLDTLYYFITEDRLGPQLEDAYTNFFTAEYIESSGWPNEEDFSEIYAVGESLDDPQLDAVSNGLNLWIEEMSAISVQQKDAMKRLSEELKTLKAVEEAEESFLKRATASSIAKKDEINELASEYASFVDSTKDLIIDDEVFTFTGYYSNRISQSKESVDTRINRLNESLSSTLGGDGKLSQEILDQVNKQKEDLVKAFDQIADSNLIEQFKRADQNSLGEKSGIESRIKFYRELATYLETLEKVKLRDWSLSIKTIDDLRQQYKDVFELSETFPEKQSASLDRLREIIDERLEKASVRLFASYQELLHSELKDLIGFPVFANSDRIMTKDEIADLEDELDEIMENISDFRAKMEPLEGENFKLMLGSVKDISDFAQTYLNPQMAKEYVEIGLPSFDKVNLSLSDSIVWRARFIELVDFGKQTRIGKDEEILGEVSLDEEEVTLIFTSTIGGSNGDVGRVSISDGWVPLQLLLLDDDKVKSIGRGKYIYSDQMNVAGHKPLTYSLLIVLPKELPDVDEWPRQFDLKGF